MKVAIFLILLTILGCSTVQTVRNYRLILNGCNDVTIILYVQSEHEDQMTPSTEVPIEATVPISPIP